MMLDNFLNERFRTAECSSLPDFQAIEDAASEEQEEQHQLDFDGEEHRERFESPPCEEEMRLISEFNNLLSK